MRIVVFVFVFVVVVLIFFFFVCVFFFRSVFDDDSKGRRLLHRPLLHVQREGGQFCTVLFFFPRRTLSSDFCTVRFSRRTLTRRVWQLGRGRPSRNSIYRQLETQIDELWTRMGGLPNPREAEHIWKDIWVQEAHHSTAIEGNTLVLRQVEVLLAEGRAVGSKQLTDYMEVKGYADAADWVYGQAIEPGHWSGGSLITLTEVRQIHRAVMSPVWDVAPHPDATEREGPGSFREHDIEPFPGGMRPPSWTDVPAQMQDWLDRVNALDKTSPSFPTDLAEVHCRFEQIHPFLDGNGRAGRLVLNLILVRLGYPPAIIYKGERKKYVQGLRRADQGDCGALGEFIARAVLANLHRFVVPAVAGPARLVPLPALASDALSVGALRTAANRGRLQAIKGADGQWRSSQQWVADYQASRYIRAPREPSGTAEAAA
jgi:fido (protein-threonine AMPylation protein)